jgi:tetratricopeptide (TPR) repeat protein
LNDRRQALDRRALIARAGRLRAIARALEQPRELLDMLVAHAGGGQVLRKLARGHRARALNATLLAQHLAHLQVAAQHHALHIAAVLEKNRGNVSEAIDALDHAVRLNPDDPHVRASRAAFKSSLAYKANEESRLEDAITLYEESVALDGTVPGTWYNLGIAYQVAKRYDEAIKAYETALRLDPQQPHARQALNDVKHRLR